MPKGKSKVAFIFLLGSYMALSVMPSFAQGICELKKFRLEKIKGKVVSDGPRADKPIVDAKAELWRVGGEDVPDTLVASALSDKNGLFEISNIKKGRYRLEVSKWGSGFVGYSAGVDIVKKVEDAEREKQLVFRLGVETLKACGGSDVTAEAQTLITKVVRFEIDGKEIKKNYRVFLFSDENETELEAQRTSEGFVVPDYFRNEKFINTRIIFGKYDLLLFPIPISKFNEEWRIGIDKKPFSGWYVQPEEAEKLKLVYYLEFDYGQLIFKVPKDSLSANSVYGARLQ